MMTVGTKIKLINPKSESDWLVGDAGVVDSVSDGGLSVQLEEDGRIVVVAEDQIEIVEAAEPMTEAEVELSRSLDFLKDVPDEQPPLEDRLRESMLQYSEGDLGRREFNELIEKHKNSASLIGNVLMTLTQVAMEKSGDERAVRTAIMEAFFAGRAVERVMTKERAA